MVVVESRELKRHNWFEVEGELRTTTQMTSRELRDLLDQIEDAFGIRFLGSIGYSETTDEDYGDVACNDNR